jgi:hypothetical protein
MRYYGEEAHAYNRRFHKLSLREVGGEHKNFFRIQLQSGVVNLKERGLLRPTVL